MIRNLAKEIEEASQVILQKSSVTPKVGITLGSGLGDFVDSIENIVEIPFGEIPHFKKTSVSGHQGKLFLGLVGEVEVACLQGRIHYYEGHSAQEVVFPTRVLQAIGCSYLLLSNVAGGINSSYHPGDLVIISDHLNLTGTNPLQGSNEDRLGPRFPDMQKVYHPQVREALKAAFLQNGLTAKEGIYAGVQGPSYETVAEVEMLKRLGADLVGMSTVLEAIAGHHCQLKVGAVSLVSNMAAGLGGEELKHRDVQNKALMSKSSFGKLVASTVGLLQ